MADYRHPAERYDLKKPLGSGGFARVHPAYDRQREKWVALKRLQEKHLGNREIVDRFRRERDMMRTILSSHPNVPNYYDDGEWEVGRGLAFPYYTMQYLRRGSAAKRLKDRNPFTLEEMAHALANVVSALTLAHGRGIMHRDIKPSNILLGRDRYYLIDFGVATAPSVHEGDDLTGLNHVIGTFGYIAPEVLDNTPATVTSDIYSLGVTVFEMMSGRQMHKAMAQTSVDPWAGIPTPIAYVIFRAVEPDPRKRHPTAQAFLDDFNRAMRTAQPGAQPPPPTTIQTSGLLQPIPPTGRPISQLTSNLAGRTISQPIQSSRRRDAPVPTQQGPRVMLWVMLVVVVFAVIMLVILASAPEPEARISLQTPTSATDTNGSSVSGNVASPTTDDAFLTRESLATSVALLTAAAQANATATSAANRNAVATQQVATELAFVATLTSRALVNNQQVAADLALTRRALDATATELAFRAQLNDPSTRAINFGQVVSGTINRNTDRWNFNANRGDVVTISMRSDDFDTFLRLEDSRGTELTFNDDGGEGLNSLIEDFILPSTGRYTIVADSFVGGGEGFYQLRLSRGGSSSVPTARPTATNTTRPRATPVPSRTRTPPPTITRVSGRFSAGQVLPVRNFVGDNVWIRSAPNGPSIVRIAQCSQVVIISNETQFVNGQRWWQVRAVVQNQVGWVEENLFQTNPNNCP